MLVICYVLFKIYCVSEGHLGGLSIYLCTSVYSDKQPVSCAVTRYSHLPELTAVMYSDQRYPIYIIKDIHPSIEKNTKDVQTVFRISKTLTTVNFWQFFYVNYVIIITFVSDIVPGSNPAVGEMFYLPPVDTIMYPYKMKALFRMLLFLFTLQYECSSQRT